MKKFHSYGPVDSKCHYCADRKELVESCTNQLIGSPHEPGHYFTIWAPRQSGKTWLLRQSVRQIKKLYADTFTVAEISIQGYVFDRDEDAVEAFLEYFQKELERELDFAVPGLNSWNQWIELFAKQADLFKKPLILFIYEFDRLPLDIIDQVVSLLRHMYLSRNKYLLHGLALIGVRAVLGVDSKRGSPFNVQRSIYVPNLTIEEVRQMFGDYQSESGQEIESHVIETLYEKTSGQPGLVGWFGELLTEKYNAEPAKTIDTNLWHEVYSSACNIEHNNTVQNILIKGKGKYKPYIWVYDKKVVNPVFQAANLY